MENIKTYSAVRLHHTTAIHNYYGQMCSDIENEKTTQCPTHSSTYLINIEWFPSVLRDLEMSGYFKYDGFYQ